MCKFILKIVIAILFILFPVRFYFREEYLVSFILLYLFSAFIAIALAKPPVIRIKKKAYQYSFANAKAKWKYILIKLIILTVIFMAFTLLIELKPYFIAGIFPIYFVITLSIDTLLCKIFSKDTNKMLIEKI